MKLLGAFALIGGAYQIYRMYNGATLKTISEKMTNPTSQSDNNVRAFLAMIRQAEGATYNTLYGGGSFSNMSDHPYITGEWKGKVLSARMCANAGLSAGCKTTAAGAYQATVTTWRQYKLENSDWEDFSAGSQDRFALWLIRKEGALSDIKNGNFAVAVAKVANRWASLPGSTAQQNPKSIATVQRWYQNAGGQLA